MSTKGTILIVDDTPADLELLADTLTAQGYQVLTTDSGEAALAAIAARPPELILMDIQMPGLDGFEVCRRLKAQPESRDLPIMLVSVSGESAERVEGLKLGAVDYITKPFDRGELLARLHTHLELGRLRVRLERQAADLRQANAQLQCELAERKQAELEIQRQAAFPRFNPNPVLELSAAGEIAYLNEAAKEMARALGLENPAQMLPPNTLAMVRECLATGKSKLRVETQIGPRVISWSFFPVQFNNTVHCYAGDITERKRAEEASRASQQIIEGILNAIPVRVFWKDKNLVYLGCNAVFARDAGFADPKDIIGKDDYQMGWRDQAELYRGDDRQVIETGCAKLLIEESQTTPEGNTITLLSSKIPLRGSNGEVSGVIGMYMDITERKQAEEVLRQRMKLQDQLVRLAATVPGMIYSLLMRPDGSTRMPYASGALSEIFDLQPKDLVQDAAPVFSMIHPDDLGHVLATIAESARTLNPWRDDFRVCHTRLGQIWVEGHSVPQREPDGSTLWHGFVQNITKRKRAEEGLQQSEGRMRAITDSAQDAILMMDPQGRVSYWNPAAERILGYTGAEARGQNLHDLLAPARYHPAHHTAFPAFQQTGQGAATGKTLDLAARRKDGQEIAVQLSLSAVQMSDGWHAVGLMRDITERKRVEEELRRTSELLLRTGELAKIGGWDLDLRTMKLFWALETCRIHEVDPPVAPALDQAINFYAPEARPVIRAAVQAGIDSGTPFDLDLPLTTANGRPIWVRAQGSAVMEDGKAVKLLGAFQDITERRQGEAALRRSEAKFRTLYDSISDAVMLSDQKGFFDCNPATLTMFGCATREEFCSKHPADVSPPVQPDGTDSLTLAKQHIATAMEKGSSQFEWMHKRADTGETFPAEVLLCALELDGKRVLLGSVRDITERKRSEESLGLQTAALEAAANGVAITDPKGTILWVNPAFTHLTGYSREEAIGQNPRVLKSGQHSESFYKELWQTISTGHVWKGEIVNRRKDGHLYDEEMTITPVQDRAGQVSHFVAVKQDITKRKRAEEELREKERLLSESQRLGHIGSWFWDMTSPMRWSEELYCLYGVSPDTFTPTAESLLGLVHPDDRPAMRAWMAACAAGEKPGESVFRINLPDGTTRFISGHGDAVHDAGNRLIYVAGTAQDITERKAVETELAELHKQLMDASREAGMAEIATSVLHNVGNVLNSINVSTGLVVASVKNSRASSLARVVTLLQDHAQDLGAFITQDSRGKHVPALLAQLAEHLQAEQDANVRELELLRRNVDHVKEIVAMQQNYAAFGGVKEMINVVTLVEDSLRINEGALSRHEVEVIREFEDVPPLNGEKHKILQILVNLLRNAKYACHDLGSRDKRLTVRVANAEGRIRISVMDNGVGIPPENLTRIFNHGFTTRKDGHGFGLHSGALAAKEMGGSLTVHSDGLGQGASFTLELPLAGVREFA